MRAKRNPFMDSNNDIHICGKLVESMTFDHELYGEKFYSTIIEVQRPSGTADTIRLSVSERFVKDEEDYKGKRVVLDGQVRTYRSIDEEGSHVMVYIHVKSMYEVSGNLNENKVRFNGYICKVSKPRRTLRGNKQLSDVILAVNRDFNKSDYIPCICWSDNADLVYKAGVGANIELIGRLQSRPIKKGAHIVYEVSVNNVRVAG